VGVWEGRDDLRDKHIQDITVRFEKIPTCLTGADLSHKHLSIGWRKYSWYLIALWKSKKNNLLLAYCYQQLQHTHWTSKLQQVIKDAQSPLLVCWRSALCLQMRCGSDNEIHNVVHIQWTAAAESTLIEMQLLNPYPITNRISTQWNAVVNQWYTAVELTSNGH